MRRAGVSESVIMEITGHSRGEVIDRYNQVTLEDMRWAIEKLTNYRKSFASVDQNVDQVPFLASKKGSQKLANPLILFGAEEGTRTPTGAISH